MYGLKRHKPGSKGVKIKPNHTNQFILFDTVFIQGLTRIMDHIIWYYMVLYQREI